MSLYLRHRFSDLDFIEGEANKASVKALKSQIAKTDPPHSFLFVGEPGTGKTSISRVLAKEFGCDEIDIHEINCSSDNGVDDIRAILQELDYLPRNGKAKAYILDEFHRMTGSAQDCLLKPLEEPPSHVFWFLCTTETKKILPTIVSRCVVTEMKLLSMPEMRRYLTQVATLEEKVFDREILTKIADASKGRVRDALSLLEKILDVAPDHRAESLNLIFDEENSGSFQICQALSKKLPWADIAVLVSKITDEPEIFRKIALGYFSKTLLNTGAPKYFKCADVVRGNFFDEGKHAIVLAAYEMWKILGE